MIILGSRNGLRLDSDVSTLEFHATVPFAKLEYAFLLFLSIC